MASWITVHGTNTLHLLTYLLYWNVTLNSLWSEWKQNDSLFAEHMALDTTGRKMTPFFFFLHQACLNEENIAFQHKSPADA